MPRLALAAAIAFAAAVALLCGAAAARAASVQTLGSGAWCWFADPRAITDGGQTYAGWVARDGDILVSSIDHASGERVTAVLESRLDVDDHANPALQLRGDGRLAVYYSAHKGATLSYRVSERPADVRSWGPPRQIPTNTLGGYGFTYPNPQHLEAEQRTYLFWRGGNFQPAFSTLADGGEEWAPARQLIDAGGGRPYVKFAGDGERTIHFAFTNRHPNEDGDVNIHYAAYREGELFRADGSAIGALDAPIAPEEADLVFDRPENAWVHDVAIDPAGRPVIVFASFPSLGNHVYHYARWTGEAWDLHEITEAGASFHAGDAEPMYSGGLTLDHGDPSRVHLSRQVGDGWQIETWTTADGGTTWESEPLTPPGGNFRPVAPRGQGTGPGFPAVLWMSGEYRSYTDYRTRIVGSSGLPASPTLDVARSPEAGEAPLVVELDAAVIEGDAGPATRWEWEFGDGARSAEGPGVEHSYAEPGVYFPALTATDAAGRRDTFVTEIRVAPGPTSPIPTTSPPPPDPPPAVDQQPSATPSEDGPESPARVEPGDRRPALRIQEVRWGARGARVRLECAGSRPCRGRLVARRGRSGRLLAHRRVRVAPATARWVTLRLSRRASARRRQIASLLLSLERPPRP